PGGLILIEDLLPRTATIEYVKFTKIAGNCAGPSTTYHGTTGWTFFDGTNGSGLWTFGSYIPGPALNDPVCSKVGHYFEYDVEVKYTTPDALVLQTQDDGNCSDNGTALCPGVWKCNSSAPTTINGVPVSAEDVRKLGSLYPGDVNACVNATKSRSCSG